MGRHAIYTSGTAPYNYIHLFRIANSSGYSTLDCEIDFRTRHHSAKLEIRIITAQHPYNSGGSSISIVKKVVSGRSCNFWILPTVQTSNYNYYDVYYESGVWNSGSYGIISKGSNGALVFEHKGTNLTSLPDKVIPVSNNVATSATKLQTPISIWGQSFNGTANVSGSITGVDNITMSNNSYLYGKNTGGTAIQLIAMASWNSVDIGRGALTYGYTTQVMGKTVALTASDDSGKNTKSVELSTAKFYSNVNIETEGGLLAHRGVTAYSSSDIRLKQDLRKLDYFGIIKAMGGTFGFAWKKDNTRSIGWIAQHVLCNPHLKDIVETDENGYYKINYWSPKLIATAFGAIEQVGDEVSRLKARVIFLESEVQRLSGDKEDCNKKRLDNKNINLLN